MKVKNDLVRFKMYNRYEECYCVIPRDCLWGIRIYPESKYVDLITDKETISVEGTETDILTKLKWKE